jgi:hypothetical protein
VQCPAGHQDKAAGWGRERALSVAKRGELKAESASVPV